MKKRLLLPPLNSACRIVYCAVLGYRVMHCTAGCAGKRCPNSAPPPSNGLLTATQKAPKETQKRRAKHQHTAARPPAVDKQRPPPPTKLAGAWYQHSRFWPCPGARALGFRLCPGARAPGRFFFSASNYPKKGPSPKRRRAPLPLQCSAQRGLSLSHAATSPT